MWRKNKFLNFEITEEITKNNTEKFKHINLNCFLMKVKTDNNSDIAVQTFIRIK